MPRFPLLVRLGSSLLLPWYDCVAYIVETSEVYDYYVGGAIRVLGENVAADPSWVKKGVKHMGNNIVDVYYDERGGGQAHGPDVASVAKVDAVAKLTDVASVAKVDAVAKVTEVASVAKVDAVATIPCIDAFDCDAGLAEWKSEWSQEKKQWCCEHKEKGWPGCLSALPVGTGMEELKKKKAEELGRLDKLEKAAATDEKTAKKLAEDCFAKVKTEPVVAKPVSHKPVVVKPLRRKKQPPKVKHVHHVHHVYDHHHSTVHHHDVHEHVSTGVLDHVHNDVIDYHNDHYGLHHDVHEHVHVPDFHHEHHTDHNDHYGIHHDVHEHVHVPDFNHEHHTDLHVAHHHHHDHYGDYYG